MRSTTRLLATTLVLAIAAVACAADSPAIKTITAEDLRARLQTDAKPMLVDVREQNEWDEAHIAEATLAPLAAVVDKMKDVPRDREILLICRSGRRSGIAYTKLEEKGFSNLRNVEGGMLAWQKLGYPVVKKQP